MIICIVTHVVPNSFFFSQSLINLLLSGKAVTNVWDNDKDISGLSKYKTLDVVTLNNMLVYPNTTNWCWT